LVGIESLPLKWGGLVDMWLDVLSPGEQKKDAIEADTQTLPATLLQYLEEDPMVQTFYRKALTSETELLRDARFRSLFKKIVCLSFVCS